MAKPSPLLSFFCLIFVIFLSFPCSSATYITSIINFSSSTSSAKQGPWQRLNQHASASLIRAHHLKYSETNNSIAQTNLFPHSYGAYSISLAIGTPPQTLSVILDTGSSPTWLPCTHHYNCSDCNFQGINPQNISTFIPELSTSAKIVDCNSPKCHPISSAKFPCFCTENLSQHCNQSCQYFVPYGIGSTSGILLSETLHFPNKTVTDFSVGCSSESSSTPAGIAGFGRKPNSLPGQMGIKKFSYCLVSHKFDDTSKSSELVMVPGEENSNASNNATDTPSKLANLSYIPFATNPKIFQTFYYVNITKITVGQVDVNVPYTFLVPGPDGIGGTIVDSGTTFTVLDNEVFELVVKEFEKQMSHYRRAPDVEKEVQLSPCYNVSGENVVDFPELAFYSEGGSKMEVSMSYNLEPEQEVVCLTLLPSEAIQLSGPSIILGNYQQQDLYMEFDLENERLGFRKQIC